ncbi:GYD domain-containing protein [Paraburkholderia phymatum]|uniref:GYD family protein n=1 Tax=Paraburkholderia phymatum (strain DSM 17167 / CIP 108236 / LMG 21445 / STM815) TaxID=391038 RepID=B2JGN9_PARP8|nr:GYD domain-containing protein [Paraburkholderia phymatum]ACC70224.1 GYD family protein [Paraburkholderia phymatum STM815]
MATYIMLVNWTDQGVRTAKDTVNRARAFRETSKAMGVTVSSLNWTLGAYDLVISIDSPDDETTTRLGLAVAALGNVRTSTMRAFGEDEMARIVGGLK